MGRVAILVDAGYVWHGGVEACLGSQLSRDNVDLHIREMVDLLKAKAVDAACGSSVLRVYWYDAVAPAGFEPMQRFIAMATDVKFRAGTLVRSAQRGQRQKGVDTLIVADMIDLARNGAVSDILLWSGDDDLRVGVQLAQSAGVRVHLAGNAPAALSQSRNLRQEADTLMELTKDDLGAFISAVPQPNRRIGIERARLDSLGIEGAVREIVSQTLDAYGPETWDRVFSQHQTEEFTVPWVARRLVGGFRSIFKRNVAPWEARSLHRTFAQELTKRVTQP